MSKLNYAWIPKKGDEVISSGKDCVVTSNVNEYGFVDLSCLGKPYGSSHIEDLANPSDIDHEILDHLIDMADDLYLDELLIYIMTEYKIENKIPNPELSEGDK